MTAYRVMIKGENWIGQAEFEEDPAPGTEFTNAGGWKLVVQEVRNDPISADTPDKLIVTTRV